MVTDRNVLTAGSQRCCELMLANSCFDNTYLDTKMTSNRTHLPVELALSLALGLGLARQGKIGEVVLGALGVRSQQLGFLGVQER